MACPTFGTGDAFLFGMMRAIDCHAQTIGANGYQALASPTSSVSLLTTGVLTIFVALFGYRMLVGETPSLRDLVMALVKIGFVLMLATSWPAYRVLVYDVTMRGPAELAAAVGVPAGLPGARGLAARLQQVDDQYVEFARLNSANLSSMTQNPDPSELVRWDPVKDRETINSARSIFLSGSILAYGAVRIVGGLLLALGPLFVLFLLFEGTSGLFAGWLRGLLWSAVGSLATTIGIGVQLAVTAPWFDQLLTLRRGGAPAYQAPVELFVISLVFALLSAALLFGAALVARGFRIPDRLRVAVTSHVGNRITETFAPRSSQVAQSAASGERNRAATVADAVAATQRREQALRAPATVVAGGAGRAPAAVAMDIGAQRIVPLGETYRSRVRGRVSASARRRDARG